MLAGNDTISHFQEILSAHIGRFKRYPQDAVRERLQGTVQIVFVMNRGGELLDLWVDKSSGYDFFDKERWKPFAARNLCRRFHPTCRIV